MMRLIHKKEGFTLIELLIVILTGSIVTMAATTVLLLAFRINKKSMDTISRQSVTRIMLSVLENMSSDEKYVLVNNTVEDSEGNLAPETMPDSTQEVEFWSISNADDDAVLIKYDPSSDKIVSGSGEVLVEDVEESLLYRTYTPFDYVRDVYTFSVKIEGKTYNSTVYSRTQEEDWRADDPLIDHEDGRNALVAVASSQVGSTGRILDMSDRRLKDWYTQWYVDEHINRNITDPNERTTFISNPDIINGLTPEEIKNTWNIQTPWCATFVSWVLNQCAYVNVDAVNGVDYLYELPQDASVNYLWLENFVLTDQYHMKVNAPATETTSAIYHTPLPGDLIFFEYCDPYDPINEPEDKSEPSLVESQSLEGMKNLVNNQRDALNLAMWRERNLYFINTNLSPDNDKYIISPSEYALSTTDKASYVNYDVMKHYLKCVGDGLDHVGIVAKVEGDYVYTIEGNVGVQDNSTSGNDVVHQVIIRKHALNNPDIFGYATLNWAGNP